MLCDGIKRQELTFSMQLGAVSGPLPNIHNQNTVTNGDKEKPSNYDMMCNSHCLI